MLFTIALTTLLAAAEAKKCKHRASASTVAAQVSESLPVASAATSAAQQVTYTAPASSTLSAASSVSSAFTSVATSAQSVATAAASSSSTAKAAATAGSASSGSSSGTSSALSSENSGQATFYGGNLSGGNCMFDGVTLPDGMYGTALSSDNWDSSFYCGACLKVTGPSGNTIDVMVVDKCPGCGLNHLDLFPDAFDQLAAESEGVIDVSWEVIECGISTPLSVRNKSGTSEYWFSMQVINANVPVSGLEVSTDGGNTWTSTERQDYDYFQKSDGSGFNQATVSVKVTCENGNSVIISDVGTTAGASYEATSNC